LTLPPLMVFAIIIISKRCNHLLQLWYNYYMNKPLSDEKFAQKFWSNVEKTDSCWLWTASINTQGYGNITRQYKKILAHRYSYEHSNGFIPSGHEIDHLCENKICVKPDHLVAITRSDHAKHTAQMIRKMSLERTHCANGHELNDENSYLYSRPNGAEGNVRRVCRSCKKMYA